MTERCEKFFSCLVKKFQDDDAYLFYVKIFQVFFIKNHEIFVDIEIKNTVNLKKKFLFILKINIRIKKLVFVCWKNIPCS